MAALTLVLAAGGLAATTFLVADGSRAEPPAADFPGLLCLDVGSGQVHQSRDGRCAPRVQVELPTRAGQP